MAITSLKQLTVSMTVKSFIYNFIENIWYIYGYEYISCSCQRPSSK